MKPIWVLQTNFVPQSPTPLIEVLREQDIEIIECEYVPFARELRLSKDIPHNLIIPVGLTTLIKISPKSWKGLFFNEHHFRPTKWVSSRNDMLNSDLILTTFGKAIEEMPADGEWFIRPNGDLKDFPGEITNRAKFRDWAEKVIGKGYDLTEQTPVVISPLQRVIAEYRFFVVDGEVIDGSMYRFNGRRYQKRLEQDDEAMIVARQMAKGWMPAACVCMDVALTPEGYRVIEFNCINATGWYDNDLSAIVKAVTAYVGEVRF